MNNTDIIVLSIVEDVLGKHRITKDSNPQKYFNCRSQKCRHDHDKYNLSFNSDSKIFKCWKCQTKGTVHTLVKNFGSKIDLDKLNLILPYYNTTNNFFKKNIVDYNSITCDLPKEYLPLWETRDTFKYRQALKYVLEERKLTLEEIRKYEIGYTEEGNRKLRIIIPSFNKNNEINYYEARSYWKEIKQSYMKPDSPDKDDIIFNEKYINYDIPVILVEGFLDSVRIPNSIPMLGKKPSNLLIARLLEHKSKVVLCLDEDALHDCYEIFKLFSSLGLDVYYIDMFGFDDISKTYETKGNCGIKEVLKRISKLNLETFIEKMLKYKK